MYHELPYDFKNNFSIMISKIILALSICALVVALLYIIIKIALCFVYAVSKERRTVDFTTNIVTVGISVLLIAVYFIF